VRVLVAGATGDVGRPTVRALVRAGHDVHAMTRKASRAGALQAAGAEPIVADALDAGDASRTVADAKPDAVVDLMTALPRNGPMRPSDLDATNVIRTRGTANLLAAAGEAGVQRYVAESVCFVYGYGDRGSRPLTEDDPPESEAAAAYRPALEAALEKERRVTEGAPSGCVVRYGVFYGPDVGSTRYMARMLRRRMLGLPGGGHGVVPWIHVEDAAAATVAAVERGRSGAVYNVVDDRAASFREFAEALAAATGLPRPYGVPRWLVRPFLPYVAVFMSSTRLRVSNERAKRDLAWAPSFPTYREGVVDVAAGLTGRTSGRSAPS
jgi:nucleoside-diphosphate-sugar epimerase